MTILILWFIMAYGMTNILVYGSIFNGPREAIKRWGDNSSTPFNKFGKFLTEMLACMMCASVWVGFFFGMFLYSPTKNFLETNYLVSWFFDGMLSSGAVWAINSIIEWFEENRPS